MSIIEHASVPAGWYPDQADEQRLRWWNGAQWTDDVRPLLIDMVPDFTADIAPVVPIFAAPVVADREPIAPVIDITSRLASAPERLTPAPTSIAASAPLTRRQLREKLGRALTTEVELSRHDAGFPRR